MPVVGDDAVVLGVVKDEPFGRALRVPDCACARRLAIAAAGTEEWLRRGRT
jgi:hypothetical protein